MNGTVAEAVTVSPPHLVTWSFDALVGYNALLDYADKAAAIYTLTSLLTPHAIISLAERIPRHTQRLYRLVDLADLGDDLRQRLIAAEEAIYADAADPLVNWDVDDLVQLFRAAGFAVEAKVEEEHTDLQVTPGVIERWFAPSPAARPSYGDRLGKLLSPTEVAQVRALFARQLSNQTLRWGGRVAFLTASA